MPSSPEQRGRVVVAGATGYLGKYVVRAFKQRGHRVRALNRSKERVGPVRGKISIRESFEALAAGKPDV